MDGLCVMSVCVCERGGNQSIEKEISILVIRVLLASMVFFLCIVGCAEHV